MNKVMSKENMTLDLMAFRGKSETSLPLVLALILAVLLFPSQTPSLLVDLTMSLFLYSLLCFFPHILLLIIRLCYVNPQIQNRSVLILHTETVLLTGMDYLEQYLTVNWYPVNIQ